MKVAVRHTVLVLFVWSMLVGVCLGKQVYLKDGSIIAAQSAWRHGDKVFVKVNRDIVADFNLNEIDLRRTFPKAGHPSRHAHPKVAASTATEAASAPPAPGAKPGPKPAVQPDPAVATAPKAAAAPMKKGAPQPSVAPDAPAEPSATPDKTEMQHRAQEASKKMVEAITNKDPEMMKKALEEQRSAMQQQGAAGQVKPALPLSVLLIILAVCILIIASQWIIFQKGGQAGWKSLVPFYNMYILMEISGKPGWWMFLLFIPLVGFVIYLFAMLSLAKKFGRSELFGVGLLLLPMIFFPLLAFGGSEYEG